MNILDVNRHAAVTTVVLTSFMVLLVGGYLYYDFTWMAIGAFFMLSLAFCGRRHILRREFTSDKLIIVIILSAMSLSWPFALYKTPSSLFHYGIGILSVLAAYVLSRFPRATCRSIGLTLFILQGLTVVFLISVADSTLPLDNMINDASSNGITSVMIVVQAVYAWIHFHIHRKAPIITPFITLYICLEGYSRGSILAAAMVCATVVSIRIFSIRSRVRRGAGVLLLLSALLIFWIAYFDVLTLYLLSETKLGQGLMDPYREEIHWDYLGKIDYLTFFTGADFAGTSIVTKYNGNPHSSLIRAHHLFGIIYVAAILVVLMIGMRTAASWKDLTVKSGLVLIILFRSLSEPILFPTPLDFFLFLLLFVGGKSILVELPETRRRRLGGLHPEF